MQKSRPRPRRGHAARAAFNCSRHPSTQPSSAATIGARHSSRATRHPAAHSGLMLRHRSRVMTKSSSQSMRHSPRWSFAFCTHSESATALPTPTVSKSPSVIVALSARMMNLLPADRLTTGPRRWLTLHSRCQSHATIVRAAAPHGGRAICRGRRQFSRQDTAARVRDGRAGHRAFGTGAPAGQRARPLAFAARHRNAITNATGVTFLLSPHAIKEALRPILRWVGSGSV